MKFSRIFYAVGAQQAETNGSGRFFGTDFEHSGLSRRRCARKRSFPIVLVLLLLGGALWAAELEGVRLPDTLAVEGQSLVLNGLGLRQATIFKVSVYVAGLYLPAKSADALQILGMPGVKCLRMQFVRDVGVGDLRDAWTEGIRKNGEIARLGPSLAKLNGMMTDMKVKDTLEIVFTPTEVKVKVKGVDKGAIPDPVFSRVLLAVWLGPSPPNSGLKQGLLGK